MLRLALMLPLLLTAPETFRPDNDFFKVNDGKPLLDAHNCYPDDGKWKDRLGRALATGLPVGIEQDIAPYVEPGTGTVIAKVTHRNRANASEPSLRDYFFEHVRPLVEQALRDKHKENWPLIVLHFDFKDNSAPTLEAVWKLLGEYEDWISTATKTDHDEDLSRIDWGPLLVMTEENDLQEEIFYRRLAKGDKLRLFGSAHLTQAIFRGMNDKQRTYALAHAAPDLLLTQRASNYRRWWNNSWLEVEEGGQQAARNWTDADDERLKALADHAHRMGYWIRFYTLDGFGARQNQGWSASYNFGSQEAAHTRWNAAIAAGVDVIATDQYEELRVFMKENRTVARK
jgi:hypothetical protein